MKNPGMDRLREHLRRHNRRVLGLTAATLLVAAGMWGTLYLAVYWLVLLAGTVARPMDFEPHAGPVLRGFLATAALLCIFAWAGRRMRPNEAARDYKGLWEHLADVVLAAPRLTLAVLGLGGAAARLSDRELAEAWELLRRMNDREQPVRVSELPVEIPDAGSRERVVLALQVSGLIEIRPMVGGAVFSFRNEKARMLAQERVRLRA